MTSDTDKCRFYLLTHPREVDKPTNTGQLVLQTLGHQAERILWARTEPDEALLQAIKTLNICLLYPCEDSEPLDSVDPDQSFILLDATWQEARKMFNRSPYLQTLKKVHFRKPNPSRFCLRRNQREGGICTAESVIEVLKIKRDHDGAKCLYLSFESFVTGYGRC